MWYQSQRYYHPKGKIRYQGQVLWWLSRFFLGSRSIARGIFVSHWTRFFVLSEFPRKFKSVVEVKLTNQFYYWRKKKFHGEAEFIVKSTQLIARGGFQWRLSSLSPNLFLGEFIRDGRVLLWGRNQSTVYTISWEIQFTTSRAEN